jgi:cyclophilin family peptidyl-prolyl cis-trans isomerase
MSEAALLPGRASAGFRRIAGMLLLLSVPGAGGADDEGMEKSAREQVREYIAQQMADGRIDRSAKNWQQKLPRFPEVDFAGTETCFVILKTTKGKIKVRLLSGAAPNHVANFMYLVELGFYDGMAFQYIVPGQRALGGCPIGDGRGTPGYTFAGEYESGLGHDRAGLLSMANAGRNTDGCQLFITLGPMPWMDGRHTIFGEVVEGQETLRAIGECGSKHGRPREKVVIEKGRIEERPRNTRNEGEEG